MAKQDLLKAELVKCANDFVYFANTYLKIVDKNNQVISLKLNPAQKKIFETLQENPHLAILKARQLGSTTFIAAFFFWKTLFTPNEKTAVIAHTREAAENIFRIYQTYYEFLPKFFKFGTKTQSVRELAFSHKGSIRVSSANSQSFRGSTFTNIHASEFAFWDNVGDTISSVFQAATGNSFIVMETTANSLNDAYQFWIDNNGFEKLFISWKEGVDYRGNKAPKDLTDEEAKYIKDNDLQPDEAFWFVETLRGKCGNNLNTFNQEYPITADVAFITSGSKFFNITFGVSGWEQTGYVEFFPPKDYRGYLMGVDTASGSPNGDYSAFVIIDATNKGNINVVASYYDKVPVKTFIDEIDAAIQRYNPLVVCESNSYGLAVVDELVMKGRQLFRRIHYDKAEDRYTEKFGFNTSRSSRPILLSRLYEFVSKRWITINDVRIKFEMNNFIYNDRGRPEAASGQHDDLVMSLGLALQGLEQIDIKIDEERREKRPASVRQMIEMELETGNSYKRLAKQNYFYDQQNNSFDDYVSPLTTIYGD